jgi:hypothetical protein
VHNSFPIEVVRSSATHRHESTASQHSPSINNRAHFPLLCGATSFVGALALVHIALKDSLQAAIDNQRSARQCGPAGCSASDSRRFGLHQRVISSNVGRNAINRDNRRDERQLAARRVRTIEDFGKSATRDAVHSQVALVLQCRAVWRQLHRHVLQKSRSAIAISRTVPNLAGRGTIAVRSRRTRGCDQPTSPMRVTFTLARWRGRMCIGAAMHVTLDVDDVAFASKSTSPTLTHISSTQLRRNEPPPIARLLRVGLGRH